jgi:hypothetical protein
MIAMSVHGNQLWVSMEQDGVTLRMATLRLAVFFIF